MLRRNEADLIAYVAEHCSGVALALHDTTDRAAGVAALRRAVRAVCRIPHPDDPEDSLPSWCTVLLEDGVPVFRLDLKDESQYAEQVIRIILDELDAAGVNGWLEPRRPPEPPFDYDSRADIFYNTATELMDLDERGLPPGFPAGFPVPQEATLVLAQRARDDSWEHAAWRRQGRPFTEYPDQLGAFGCELGSVPATEVVDYVIATCMSRHSLRRGGQGGSASLYHGEPKPGQQPSNWYVSVVWQSQADLPSFVSEADIPVSPVDREVDRQVDPAVVRELFQPFVVPEYVTGCEMLLAMGEACLTVNEVVATLPSHCHHQRTFPLWQHRWLSPLVEGLNPDQLTVVRHACLTMISNWVYHRIVRLPRLSLAHDDAGYLYELDIRHGVGSSLEPKQILDLETLLTLRETAMMLERVVHNLRTAIADPLTQIMGRLYGHADGRPLDELVHGVGADVSAVLREAERAGMLEQSANTAPGAALLVRLTQAGTHQVDTAMRPRAGQLARTIEGIRPEQLIEVRDACWHIASNRPAKRMLNG